MKTKEVLNQLQIARKTFHVYAKDGRIRYTVMSNRMYNYNEEDIYKILNKYVKRKTVIYARVSTNKQKNGLQNQLQQWCFMNGNTINAIYFDVASGISFEKIGSLGLPDENMGHKVERVIGLYLRSLNIKWMVASKGGC